MSEKSEEKKDTKKRETTSLSKVLPGLDGKPLMMKLSMQEEAQEMTVRKAVSAVLMFGPDALINLRRTPLSDKEKFDCYMLARKLEDKERTGYTFKSEEVTLIKRLAAAQLPVESYGALVLELDPGMDREEEK